MLVPRAHLLKVSFLKQNTYMEITISNHLSAQCTQMDLSLVRGRSLPPGLNLQHHRRKHGRDRKGGGPKKRKIYIHASCGSPHKVVPVINDVAPACWYNNDPCRGCHDGVDEGDQSGKETQAWNHERKIEVKPGQEVHLRTTISQSVSQSAVHIEYGKSNICRCVYIFYFILFFIKHHLTKLPSRPKSRIGIMVCAFRSSSQSPLRWIRTAVQVQCTIMGLAVVHLDALSLENLTQVSTKRHEAFTTCL